ncbi:MAG: DUF1343 domain-containing protein [bacterium]|nr:DUF1343 domain-containing protein [bacterium]
MPAKFPSVKTGLDILVAEKMSRLKGLNVGLLGHPASVDSNCVHLLEHCLANKIKVKRLFGPEHGFLGNAQDMESVDETVDKKTGLNVVSLYQTSKDSLSITPNHLKDLDILVCDLQDIGSRYYTFAYTIAFALRAAAKSKIRCMILDRPNPINGISIEGNEVLTPYKSFVGEYPICNRHGLTMGELAHYFVKFDQLDIIPEVVWMKNWNRKMFFNDTKLPWVLPSPNMPTETTALVYPGACLFEGTNLSEGRGTTKPFELIGAPFIHDPEEFVQSIIQEELPGVKLRPCWFTPKFQKHANQLCGGLQIHIINKKTFLPLKTSIAILKAAMRLKEFSWRTEAYEFVSDRLAIDLLFGDDKPRKMLEANATTDQIIESFRQAKKLFSLTRKSLLHPDYTF